MEWHKLLAFPPFKGEKDHRADFFTVRTGICSCLMSSQVPADVVQIWWTASAEVKCTNSHLVLFVCYLSALHLNCNKLRIHVKCRISSWQYGECAACHLMSSGCPKLSILAALKPPCLLLLNMVLCFLNVYYCLRWFIINKGLLLLQEGVPACGRVVGIRWTFKVPSNPYHSMITCSTLQHSWDF